MNEQPLKVLHVVGAMNRAGTETMLMNVFHKIDRNKVQFDFISYSDQVAHYDTEIEKLGGRVIRLSKTQSIKALYQAIKKYGPYDVIHSHTLFHCGIANIAAFLAGIKIRISHAHTTSDNNHGLKRKIYMKIMRFIINLFSTNLLACSKGAGEYLFGKNAAFKHKYSYFPNVIDYSEFLISPPQDKIANFKEEFGLGNSVTIGHIGRFIEAKNHHFLLEVMKHVVEKDPSIQLLLVGDGDLRQEIEQHAQKDGLYANIRFAGIQEDVATALHCMDVFVFPSLYEGLGLVLLEAQASGIPCLVSEAIQPEADLQIGLVSRLSLDNGPDAWAKKILKMIDQKEKDIFKIEQGFERCGYSLQTSISRLASLYQCSHGGSYEKNVDCLL